METSFSRRFPKWPVEDRLKIVSPSLTRKIAKKQAEIEALEAQKNKLLHPVTMKSVMDKAKAAGLTPEEIAEKLGIEV